MKRKILAIILPLLTLFIILTLPSPCHASALFESNEVVSITSKVFDDLYTIGQDVNIQAIISGDLITAGNFININKNILGDVIAVGGNITIDGNVSDDVRIAGGNLKINGRVQDDLIVAGRRVTIGPKADIFGDVHVGAVELIIQGRVRGKIMGNVGLIKIEGRVDKDVEVTIDQELEFIGEGFIRGNLNYSAWKPLGIPKERIGGELIYSKIVTKENSQKHMRDKAQGTIFTIFAFLILGAVIIKLTPKYHENVINSCRKYFWKNLLAGIIWLILAPAIGVLLCITIIGIPLAIVVFALYAIIIVVAYSLSALWIGTGIYKPKRLTPWTKFGQLLLGLAIISLIWWIPMAGWLIVFVLLTSSIGAMINVVRGGKMVKKTRKRKTHG